MREDSCVFCTEQDSPCRDGRLFLGEIDEECERFELDQGAKNAFQQFYPKVIISNSQKPLEVAV